MRFTLYYITLIFFGCQNSKDNQKESSLLNHSNSVDISINTTEEVSDHSKIHASEVVEVYDASLYSGKLFRIPNIASKYITSRPVDVWLPDHYDNKTKYSVLYMHDGQMLFDANTTWNKQEWKMDEWITKLRMHQTIDNVIVVGIHNIAEERWQDLFPQKAFEYLSKAEKAKLKNLRGSSGFNLNGDNYLSFIVKELKPYIDAKFSTYPDREHTFIMGSSMGGLMSMYAYSEYPEVFAGAACLSTHWVGANPIEDNPLPQAIFKYMEDHLPRAGRNRIYFDYGNMTLDYYYTQYAPRVDALLNLKGYTDVNSKNLFFEGANHSENAWNSRLDNPLVFLLSPW